MPFHIVFAVLLAMAAPGGAQMTTVDPVRIADSVALVEVQVSFPTTGRALPVVLLSHGSHLSRHDYRPLVTALTAAGFVVIQPDHPDASRDGFPPSSEPRDGWRIRALQLRAIVRHLDRLEAAIPALRGRIDRGRIAVVGHSFGGHSAALVMGMTVRDPATGRPVSVAVPAIRAAVLLAPPGSYDGATAIWQARAPYLQVDWTAMRGPVLVVSGERDDGPLSALGPRWREQGYDRGPAGRGLCLLRIAGAGHYLGGIDHPLRPPPGDADPARIARVTQAMTAFLSASLYPDDRMKAAGWAAIRRTLPCK